MTATDTYLLLRAFCDELSRCGMRHACTSPGSRSSPIVLSLAAERRISLWSHLDERSAGFFALGAAKVSGRPVAVTSTSGTAAANLAPAVIEARWARVPLLVLTADRPPELRDVGAGQTIDQLKLYGDAVKWFFEVGVHEATPQRLRWIRTLACRAFWTACHGAPGAVHLNFPFPEPLVLDQPLPPDETGRARGHPFVLTEPEAGASPPARGCGPHPPHPSGRIVVVAGAGTADPVTLAHYAARMGIPVLADPLSGARRGPAAVAHYDLLLRSPEFTQTSRPDFIFRVGDLPTSKPLRAWLASLTDVAQVAFDPDRTWEDPDSVVGMRIRSALPMPEDVEVEPGWLDAWTGADTAAGAAIDRLLEERLSEPLVARRLAGWLGRETIVFIASSMPIRDVEEFLPPQEDPPRMLANRGANGIDGTVSSAFGVAAATGKRVVLLIGDVALAHDIGGLLAAKRLGLDLTIVLLNNDGGGIFDFLPIATAHEPQGVDHRRVFEEQIATPHGLDFAKAAELYGCEHERPVELAQLEAAVRSSLASPGTQIIEVRTDRQENVALHRRLADVAIATVAQAR
jgi:2-succinyl-5-enolpyruvyl-6-hydroxy-3-cyclohexene-1-carboxylate synthase